MTVSHAAPKQMDLELGSGDILAGFRLEKFELYNWGTFHNRIWTVELGGRNGLLTGNNGSGKSTLVDALTTLFMPAGRIIYNRAAGADARERTLRTYIDGHYKSERSESAGTRPVALRDNSSYSVILGSFCNKGYEQTVTLAQVFWTKPGETQVSRFFVVSGRPLSIEADFTRFGNDVSELRRRLKAGGVEVLQDYRKYRAEFSRLLGIRSERALNLFQQTVSMKSIGNLTEFIRNHMLEPYDVRSKIDALIAHFDDLTHAHDSIKKARRQIEALVPLVDNCSKYDALRASKEECDRCLDALEVYFADMAANLLGDELQTLYAESGRLSARLEELESRREEESRTAAELRQAMYESGGSRIEVMKAQIAEKESEERRKKLNFENYAKAAGALGLEKPETAEAFAANRLGLESIRAGLGERAARCNSKTLEAAAQRRELEEDVSLLRGEISSLRTRRSNIDSRQIALRKTLADSMGLGESELPFVGELLQVRPQERAWEGAAERILHNFGLSILVDDRYYRDVSEFVEGRHLGARLVYYRVKSGGGSLQRHTRLHPDSLVKKLEIKPDTIFSDWLYFQLGERFDYACCASVEDFRREKRAVTAAGQIKANEQRHEKDDRHRIDDRSRYILGWDNRAKIALLEDRARAIEAGMQSLDARISELGKEAAVVRALQDNAIRLESCDSFGDVDWMSAALAVERLRGELESLVASSHRLRELGAQLERLENEMKSTQKAIGDAIRKSEANRLSRENIGERLELCRRILTPESLEIHAPVFPVLESICRESFDIASLKAKDCQQRERDISKKLRGDRDACGVRMDKISEKTFAMMIKFNNENVVETHDIDASMSSSREYSEMLARLREDDLPRFEARFKKMLKDNTIREIASFQAYLNSESNDIKERIRVINESLALIEYSQGRYIELEVASDVNETIRAFKASLRACTDSALSGSDDETFSERKFQNVCEIIDRFKTRPEHSEADRKWTSFVTDVRNWHVFSASERWKETGEEYQHYTDSGGKSGGQKEKLAYTILAAGLAYQFGLDAHSTRSRTFRFVMIDEAFGKGSDESARFALSLFKTLDLQLLIVTPMQKIQVIEPYVSSVAFVHIKDDKYSLIRQMTIEEHLELKREYRRVDTA